MEAPRKDKLRKLSHILNPQCGLLNDIVITVAAEAYFFAQCPLAKSSSTQKVVRAQLFHNGHSRPKVMSLYLMIGLPVFAK